MMFPRCGIFACQHAAEKLVMEDWTLKPFAFSDV